MAVKAPPYIAGFDSASGMLKATARFLHGKDFPRVGMTQAKVTPIIPFALSVDFLPLELRKQVYVFAGASEAMPPQHAADVSSETMAHWVTSLYPQRRYPAVAIGSSNGAAVHLYAALGIPWLPQTLLIPVKCSQPIDDIQYDLNHLEGAAKSLLAANPDLLMHHMHDPSNDRLMIRRMGYFRVKRATLGEQYTRFLEEHLEPGGTIFVPDCRLTWPVTRVGDRYVFQVGAVGGTTQKQYFEGGPAVATFLACHDSPRRQWNPPAPTEEGIEAEWGFAPELGEDIERLARKRGWRVRRIVYNHPMALSPLVADLYAWWNWRRGISERRLVVDSFILMDPYLTLRTGSIPFWLSFNDNPEADKLRQYLDDAGTFDDIHLMLFPNGIKSIGQTSPNQWRDLLSRAKHAGRFMGVDPTKYPADFATLVRYHTDFKKQIAARYPMPASLTLDDLENFLEQTAGRYSVRFEETVSAQASSAQTSSASNHGRELSARGAHS